MKSVMHLGTPGTIGSTSSAGLGSDGDVADWWVRLACDDSPDMRKLRDCAAGLREARNAESLFARILGDAMRITDANLGDVRVLASDTDTDSLCIVADSGFDAETRARFAGADEGTAYGRAMRSGVQIVIADVAADPGFAPHRQAALVAGFRAVQSTPLTDHSGRLVGVVSTYFRESVPPAGRAPALMADYGRLAGEMIARRACIEALGQDEPNNRRATAPALTSADVAIRRAFCAGLDLAEARSLLQGTGIDVHFVRAVAELDRGIADLRLAALDQHSAGTEK